MKKCIVLLSGGLDSAVTLSLAKSEGFECFCLIFDYGQRHRKEIESAKKIAKSQNCRWRVARLRFPWKGSSLLDKNISIPGRIRKSTAQRNNGIPNTYVPARNIIFLSFALSYAEAIGASAIFIGAHAQDYSGYPDCRPGFYNAFKKVISTGTKSGVEKSGIEIRTPLINKNKSQIIRLGLKLGTDFGLTWSCYRGGKTPCGRCDSCFFRAKGFARAGINDPATGKI